MTTINPGDTISWIEPGYVYSSVLIPAKATKIEVFPSPTKFEVGDWVKVIPHYCDSAGGACTHVGAVGQVTSVSGAHTMVRFSGDGSSYNYLASELAPSTMPEPPDGSVVLVNRSSWQRAVNVWWSGSTMRGWHELVKHNPTVLWEPKP